MKNLLINMLLRYSTITLKNKFYRAYCESLNINNSEVDQIEKIPFFPNFF